MGDNTFDPQGRDSDSSDAQQVQCPISFRGADNASDPLVMEALCKSMEELGLAARKTAEETVPIDTDSTRD